MRRLLFALPLLCACNRPAREPTPPSRATPSPASSVASPGGVAHALPFAPWVNQATSLTWTDPHEWDREEPSSHMRRAQYRIPHVAPDTDDAEMVVITFGAGQGGDVQSNLERWYGQVTQPDGRASRDVATQRTTTVAGLRVTETEVAGRLAAGMAMQGASPPPAIEHGRLLAAIVEAPSGPWFFKITGPDATVAAARPAFDALLASIQIRSAAPGR